MGGWLIESSERERAVGGGGGWGCGEFSLIGNETWRGHLITE